MAGRGGFRVGTRRAALNRPVCACAPPDTPRALPLPSSHHPPLTHPPPRLAAKVDGMPQCPDALVPAVAAMSLLARLALTTLCDTAALATPLASTASHGLSTPSLRPATP